MGSAIAAPLMQMIRIQSILPKGRQSYRNHSRAEASEPLNVSLKKVESVSNGEAGSSISAPQDRRSLTSRTYHRHDGGPASALFRGGGRGAELRPCRRPIACRPARSEPADQEPGE